MDGGMARWAHGAVGRVTTWPDPDAYVLLDGVLVRALPEVPGLLPGAAAEVRLDPATGRLCARPAAAREPA
ncbi:hypothetical protein ACIGO8_10875 [Streptomyces sp. NPDC053493]|uniref:hypothetical protein n=1 Tax=Streptomyces sp. NPDC053493 TaxID=3365705 RepID=UPI0037CF6805